MGHPRPFSFIIVFSNKHYNSYNKYMWKILIHIHPVYGTGIQTHDPRLSSLLP